MTPRLFCWFPQIVISLELIAHKPDVALQMPLPEIAGICGRFRGRSSDSILKCNLEASEGGIPLCQLNSNKSTELMDLTGISGFALRS